MSFTIRNTSTYAKSILSVRQTETALGSAGLGYIQDGVVKVGGAISTRLLWSGVMGLRGGRPLPQRVLGKETVVTGRCELEAKMTPLGGRVQTRKSHERTPECKEREVRDPLPSCCSFAVASFGFCPTRPGARSRGASRTNGGSGGEGLLGAARTRGA